MPPSSVEQSSWLRLQAPVGVPLSGLTQGTHNSPSPQPSCPSSADCGFLETSGMHWLRHTPAAFPTDEGQLTGRYWPPPLMIGSGMQTLVPSGQGSSDMASLSITSLVGTQCAGP